MKVLKRAALLEPVLSHAHTALASVRHVKPSRFRHRLGYFIVSVAQGCYSVVYRACCVQRDEWNVHRINRSDSEPPVEGEQTERVPEGVSAVNLKQ